MVQRNQREMTELGVVNSEAVTATFEKVIGFFQTKSDKFALGQSSCALIGFSAALGLQFCRSNMKKESISFLEIKNLVAFIMHSVA